MFVMIAGRKLEKAAAPQFAVKLSRQKVQVTGERTCVHASDHTIGVPTLALGVA
jgi:hypothetical protein